MKWLICFALFAFCGCSDHPDGWEFCTYAPIDSTTERLMETERLLVSNGYKRVRISVVDFGRTLEIRATKKEGGAK